MSYVEDLDIFSGVIDRVNDPVIPDSDAVKIAIGKFFGSERSWMDFKIKEFWQDSVLQALREFFKPSLRAGRYLNRVFAQFLESLLRCFTKA